MLKSKKKDRNIMAVFAYNWNHVKNAQDQEKIINELLNSLSTVASSLTLLPDIHDLEDAEELQKKFQLHFENTYDYFRDMFFNYLKKHNNHIPEEDSLNNISITGT